MATLEERIRDLEAEIAEYRDLLTNAPPKNKLVYANLITSRGNGKPCQATSRRMGFVKNDRKKEYTDCFLLLL